MLQAQQIEELISLVGAMEKATLIERIRAFRAPFPVDFTREFLETQSLDRLRHLYLALCLHAQQTPEIPANAA